MRLQLLSLFALPFFAAASMSEQMVLPSPNDNPREPFVPVTYSEKPCLADLLTIESSASIFYSYARETELSKLFTDKDAHTTLLVPTNKAVIALPRKPYVLLRVHERPRSRSHENAVAMRALRPSGRASSSQKPSLTICQRRTSSVGCRRISYRYVAALVLRLLRRRAEATARRLPLSR